MEEYLQSITIWVLLEEIWGRKHAQSICGDRGGVEVVAPLPTPSLSHYLISALLLAAVVLATDWLDCAGCCWLEAQLTATSNLTGKMQGEFGTFWSYFRSCNPRGQIRVKLGTSNPITHYSSLFLFDPKDQVKISFLLKWQDWQRMRTGAHKSGPG